MGQGNLVPARAIFLGKNPGFFDGSDTVRGGYQALHLGESREVTRVRSLAALLSYKWRACQQATVVFDPPISGQTGFCL